MTLKLPLLFVARLLKNISYVYFQKFNFAKNEKNKKKS